jgi:hypothetical protein
MNLHLAEIATQIAPGAHAVLLVDQAGWHLSGGLIVPPNITLIPFPAKCPELNPQENELCGKVGDGMNQAADLISATASIPSLNFIPLTTFGNWF